MEEARKKFPRGTVIQLTDNGKKAYRAPFAEKMTVHTHLSLRDVANNAIPMLRVGYRDSWGRKKTRDVQAALVEEVQDADESGSVRPTP